MPREFTGVIDLDIRNSKPDWEAFLDTKAPKDPRLSVRRRARRS